MEATKSKPRQVRVQVTGYKDFTFRWRGKRPPSWWYMVKRYSLDHKKSVNQMILEELDKIIGYNPEGKKVEVPKGLQDKAE